MKKINPFLWFDSEAEQAAKFYVAIFKNSKIGKIARYPKEAAEKIGRPPRSVMTVEFTLDRVGFVALNPESFRSSSSLPKRSRSQSTARPRMRSIISGKDFTPMADRSRKLSELAQRQIRTLLADQAGLSRRYVG
jgi:3-demethylubiquinone-9 3-methyltransferase